MSGSITFDKAVYSPGEKVTAKFTGMTEDKTRLRAIELRLFAYEEIEITYRTGSGKSRSTHTTEEKIDYGFTNLLIEPEQLKDSYELEITLPPEMPSTLKYDKFDLEIDVVLGAEIKYDQSWASDDHVFAYADVRASPEIQRQSADTDDEAISLSLSDNIVVPPQMVPLTIHRKSDFDKNFRSIRLEMHTEIEGSANSRTEKNQDSKTLMTFEDIPMSKIDVEIPSVEYPTMFGSNFHIKHYLKLVVDIAFARDSNYLVPIYILDSNVETADINLTTKSEITNDFGFSNNVLEITCTNCGNAVKVGSKSCEKCGKRV